MEWPHCEIHNVELFVNKKGKYICPHCLGKLLKAEVDSRMSTIFCKVNETPKRKGGK